MTVWMIAGYALGTAIAVILILAGLTLAWLAWRTHRLHKRGEQPAPTISTPLPDQEGHQ